MMDRRRETKGEVEKISPVYRKWRIHARFIRYNLKQKAVVSTSSISLSLAAPPIWPVHLATCPCIPAIIIGRPNTCVRTCVLIDVTDARYLQHQRKLGSWYAWLTRIIEARWEFDKIAFILKMNETNIKYDFVLVRRKEMTHLYFHGWYSCIIYFIRDNRSKD